MKNFIKLLKDTLLNNSGKMSANVMAGLGVGVFAAFIGYGVYNSYDNSPAYNPAKRAIYTGEGLNFNANSLYGSGANFETPGSLSVNGKNLYSNGGVFADGNYTQSQAQKEQAKFDEARAYFDSQKSGQVPSTDAGVNGAGGAYATGETYDPFGSTYEQSAGEIEGGAAGSSGIGERQFQAAQKAAAAAAAGGAKGKNGTGSSKVGTKAVRQSTQVGKLSASNGGSSFGAGAGGGSSAGGGSASGAYPGGSAKGGDNNSRALPQANAGKTSNSETFKFGRNGGMGGFNVTAGGSEGNTKGGGRGNAKAELNAAYNFSNKAVATLHSDGEKSLTKAAQEAANAFDGGTVDEGGATLRGGVPIDISGNKLGGLKLSKSNLGLDRIQAEFETDTQKQGRLQRNVWDHMINAGIITVTACFLIAAVMKMKMKHWIKYVIAAAITAAALYAIFGADYDGDGVNIYKTISELAELRKKANMSNQSWIYYSLMCAVYPAALGLSWRLGIKGANKATSGFMEMVNETAKGEFANRMRKAVPNSTNGKDKE